MDVYENSLGLRREVRRHLIDYVCTLPRYLGSVVFILNTTSDRSLPSLPADGPPNAFGNAQMLRTHLVGIYMWTL